MSSSSPARDAMATGPVSTSGASGDADSDRARNPFGGLASGNGSALFGAQGEHETKRRRTKRWSNGDGPDGALGEHRVARPRRDGDRLGEHERSIGGADSDRVGNRFCPSASLRPADISPPAGDPMEDAGRSSNDRVPRIVRNARCRSRIASSERRVGSRLGAGSASRGTRRRNGGARVDDRSRRGQVR